jgi:hypothetical protein
MAPRWLPECARVGFKSAEVAEVDEAANKLPAAKRQAYVQRGLRTIRQAVCEQYGLTPAELAEITDP